MEDNNKSIISNRLKIGNFTINKPSERYKQRVLLEIELYNYESTEITIEQLRELHNYIGEILKNY